MGRKGKKKNQPQQSEANPSEIEPKQSATQPPPVKLAQSTPITQGQKPQTQQPQQAASSAQIQQSQQSTSHTQTQQPRKPAGRGHKKQLQQEADYGQKQQPQPGAGLAQKQPGSQQVPKAWVPGPQQTQQPQLQQQQQQGPKSQQVPQAWGPGPQQAQQPQGKSLQLQQQQQQGPGSQQAPQAWGPGPQQAQQPQGPPPRLQQQQQQGPKSQQVPQAWGPGPQQAQQPQLQRQQPQGPGSQQAPQAWGPRPQQTQQPQGPSSQLQRQQQQGPGFQQVPQAWGPKPQQAQQPQGPSPQLQRQQQQGPGFKQVPQAWGPGPQQAQQPQLQQQQQQGPGSQQAPQTWGPGPQQAQQPQGPPPRLQQQQQQGPKSQQVPQAWGPGPQQAQQPQLQRQQPQGPGSQQAPQAWGPGPQKVKGQQTAEPSTSAVSMPTTTGFGYQGPERSLKERDPLTPSLKNIYLEKIPQRSNFSRGGTAGIPIKVETNMFKIIFNTKFQTHVVQYDVAIEPDKPKFMMRPVFQQFMNQHCKNRYPAYDGKKICYSAGFLPFGDFINGEITVFDEERQQNRSFKIQLQKTAELDLSWLTKVKPGLRENDLFQKGLQALDVILRSGPSNYCVTVGRSLFQEPAGRAQSLSNGMDLWVGVFQAAVVGWKPYLNLDVSHKGFPTPKNVIEVMKELCARGYRDRDSRPREINERDVAYNKEKIERFLKGLKVQYMIPRIPTSKRTQRVNGLVECPRNNVFSLSDGSKCTVEQYFSREKNYQIQYPLLNCLWIGSRDKKVFVPPELCTIVAGQVTQKKLDEQQTSNMIRHAATNTDVRKEKIMNGFRSMRLNESPVMSKEFNLSVHGQFETVPARVLKPPKIMYQDPDSVNVFRGTWRSGCFLKPSRLEDGSWTILNLFHQEISQKIYNLHNKLIEAGKTVNMIIGRAQTPFTFLPLRGKDIRDILGYFEEKKANRLKLVIVVIPDRVETYSMVKQITELQVGLLTQCLKSKTLDKLSDSTLGNILLKINSKLNGINHILHPNTKPICLHEPSIVIGADVTHPSPDAVDIPSIAAVAASNNSSAFQYNIEIRLQPPREEMIQDLEDIMRKLLLLYLEEAGHLPKKIIFYRDGVSEGQLPQVMHYEIQAIKRSFGKVKTCGTYNPPIVFLVVQKRHHIRLFPTDKRNSDDRNFNVQAGTIVDTNITHPSHIDFYLVSHASIQGTARPTKYRCICNESNLSEDEIEKLTYYLCHMFARCTRSVSYPAPTYYAHLAAFRARALTYDVHLRLDRLKEEQKNKMTLRVTETSPMFFV